MAEFDEIKIGNLYLNKSGYRFLLISILKRDNFLLLDSDYFTTARKHLSPMLPDTFMDCEIMLLGSNKVEQRKTTVKCFWQAYDCISEVQDKSHI